MLITVSRHVFIVVHLAGATLTVLAGRRLLQPGRSPHGGLIAALLALGTPLFDNLVHRDLGRIFPPSQLAQLPVAPLPAPEPAAAGAAAAGVAAAGEGAWARAAAAGAAAAAGGDVAACAATGLAPAALVPCAAAPPEPPAGQGCP